MTTWPDRVAAWLTQRRIRAHTLLLAICLWGVCAVDFATLGPFDRAGNIKFQDSLPFYISARLISEHRTAELYNLRTIQREVQDILQQPTRVRLTYLYPPHTALFFVPLTKLSFPVAARIWAALSLLIYLACVLVVWKKCPSLRPTAAIVTVAALAFPPLFHTFIRGQFSPVILACLTVAFLALRADRPLLAGVALGFLAVKPSFLVAIPLILLLAAAWRILGGVFLSVIAQFAFTRLCFGADVVNDYLNALLHPSQWLGVAELNLAAIQMHSLRSFWMLLIPSSSLALALYLLSSVVVIVLTVMIWKSSRPLAIRFSALLLAAALVNPHLFIYDLLVLAPIFLLLADWPLENMNQQTPAVRILIYLSFILPLFGPLSYWTHVQLSVIAFAALLWTLFRTPATHAPTMEN